MTLSCAGTRRGALLLGAAGLSGLLYAQSANLRPGNYEFTSVSQVQLPAEMMARLPPGYAEKLTQPHTSQHCIADTDTAHVSEKMAEWRGQQAQQNCKVSNQSVTGNEVKMTLQCGDQTADVDMLFTGDSMKGTVVSTTDKGQKVTVNMSGHRIGDCSK
jgi:hypothetical protein